MEVEEFLPRRPMCNRQVAALNLGAQSPVSAWVPVPCKGRCLNLRMLKKGSRAQIKTETELSRWPLASMFCQIARRLDLASCTAAHAVFPVDSLREADECPCIAMTFCILSLVVMASGVREAPSPILILFSVRIRLRSATRVRPLLGVIQIAGAQQVCEDVGVLRKPWHVMSHRGMPIRVAVCDEFSTLLSSFRLYLKRLGRSGPGCSIGQFC